MYRFISPRSTRDIIFVERSENKYNSTVQGEIKPFFSVNTEFYFNFVTLFSMQVKVAIILCLYLIAFV